MLQRFCIDLVFGPGQGEGFWPRAFQGEGIMGADGDAVAAGEAEFISPLYCFRLVLRTGNEQRERAVTHAEAVPCAPVPVDRNEVHTRNLHFCFS